MELNFKPLGEVELLEKPPKDANVLVEVGGKIKRAPAKLTGGGGNGGIYTLDLSSFAMEEPENGQWVIPFNEALDIINDVKTSSGLALKAELPNNSGIPVSIGILQCILVVVLEEKNEEDGSLLAQQLVGISSLLNEPMLLMIMADYESNTGVIALSNSL